MRITYINIPSIMLQLVNIDDGYEVYCQNISNEGFAASDQNKNANEAICLQDIPGKKI